MTNAQINAEEYERGIMDLQSLPPNVGIGVMPTCNSSCVFCMGRELFHTETPLTLDYYRSFYEKKLAHVLKAADNIYFGLWGELLLLPEIHDFIKYLNKTLPDTTKCLHTNGIALTGDISNLFVDNKWRILISLHASNAELHEKMTGTQRFDAIVRNIEYIAAQKTNIVINVVVTLMNIEDLPNLIGLARNLGVGIVKLDYIMVKKPAQLQYSVFFNKKLARDKILEAKACGKSFDIDVQVPVPLFGDDSLTGRCALPWNSIMINGDAIDVCCFLEGDNIGNLRDNTFDEIWNGKEYQNIRKGILGLRSKTPCISCCFYKAGNVENIDSHISFRTQDRDAILGEYRA